MRAETLGDEFERLIGGEDPHRRGYDLEELVKRLFRSAHFNVKKNPKGASPRQTDLIATRGSLAYLVETKWTQAPADVDVVDGLYARLERMPVATDGLLISVNGFTPAALETMRSKRHKGLAMPIGEKELRRLLSDPVQLAQGLGRMREELLVEGELDSDDLRARRQRLPALDLAEARVLFSLPDGSKSPVMISGGELTDKTFVRELPDIDWVKGSGCGVSWDLPVAAYDQEDLVWLLGELSEIEWATPGGHWNISQTDVNWHGVGATALADALRGWEARYAELERAHHTERLCYVDAVPDGFYTLMADVIADSRRVWHASLSFQLSGIPFDPEPLRRFAETVAPGARSYFRPRDMKSVSSLAMTGSRSLPLQTVATVTEREEDGPLPDEEWVVGVVVKNPFPEHQSLLAEHRQDLADLRLERSELLVCDLGNWHPSSEPRAYRLVGLEWAYSSDVMVLRARADWDDQTDRESAVIDQQASDRAAERREAEMGRIQRSLE